MRSRVVAVVVLALTTATMVAGCGGDGDSGNSAGGYCGDLQSARDGFSGLLNNQLGQDAFTDFRSDLGTLTKEAPPGVTKDWATFSNAVEKFAVAMNKAGLTIDDMRDMGTGDMPGGMDMETAMDAAAALGSAEVSTAVSRIVANAAKTCSIDLNA
jgi:hypothetical protein